MLNCEIKKGLEDCLYFNEKCICRSKIGYVKTTIAQKYPIFEVCKLTKCSEKCENCLTTEKCSQCTQGFNLTPNFTCSKNTDSLCKKGFETEIKGIVCFKKPKFCKVYSFDKSKNAFKCEICETGFDLDSNQRCKPIITFLDLFHPPIKNSIHCLLSRKNICQKCSLGYYLFENQCKACESQSVSCYYDIQLSKQRPIKCKNERFLDIKTNKCLPKKSNTKQKNCSIRKYYSAELDNCLDCQENCKVCNSKSSCQVCERGFELTSDSKCKQQCNIDGIFSHLEEQYLSPTSQCLNCSECKYCQQGLVNSCISCSKCDKTCQFDFIKITNGKFVFKSSNLELGVLEIQKRYPELIFKRSEEIISGILLEIDMTPNKSEIVLNILRSEINTLSCRLPKNSNITIKMEQKILKIEEMQKVVRKLNTSLSTSKTGVVIGSFLASQLGLLIEFLNISSLFNFGISKNNNENSLTGHLKNLQKSLFDPFSFSWDRAFLGLSRADEIEIFHAFMSSSLGQVWQIPFFDFIWWIVLIFAGIVLGLCFLNKIWTPMFFLMKEYTKFLETEPSEEEILKVDETLDHMRFFRFFKRKPRLLKIVQKVLYWSSFKKNSVYCSFLVFNGIGDFSMLYKSTNLMIAFPRKYTLRLGIWVIFRFIVFFYFFFWVCGQYLKLKKLTRLTIRQIEELLQCKRSIFLVLQYMGLVMLSLIFSRFQMIYHSGVLIYIFSIMVCKIFTQSVFENFFQIYLVDIVLFGFFYFLNFYDLYVLNYFDSYLFDVFFVALNVSHIVNMIASCRMKIKPEEKN